MFSHRMLHQSKVKRAHMREPAQVVTWPIRELNGDHIKFDMPLNGLNISPVGWIQRHSSLMESELMSGRSNEGSDSVPLPNTTGSSGLAR